MLCCANVSKKEKVCLIVGVVTLTISLVVNGFSIAFLALENKHGSIDNGSNSTLFVSRTSTDNETIWNAIATMNRSLRDAIIGAMLAVGMMIMTFSMLLIIGLTQNKPGFVLSYFVCGVLVSIVLILGALLELLNNFWIIAMLQLLFVVIFIPFLIVVHSIYEFMQTTKEFAHNDLERLYDSTDFSSEMFDDEELIIAPQQ